MPPINSIFTQFFNLPQPVKRLLYIRYMSKAPNRQKLLDRLRHKYRFVVVDNDTLEEQVSFRLSQMNIYVFISTLMVLMVLLTAFLIVATPLKEYIPGYDDSGTRRKVYQLSIKSDSLEKVVKQQNAFIGNVKNVLSDQNGNTEENTTQYTDTSTQNNKGTFNLNASEEELELRNNLEKETQFATIGDDNLNARQLRNMQIVNLMTPVKGLVSANFEPVKDHLGIDIVTTDKEPVKAAADGVVIVAEWTIDTGYIIAIQHADNLVTFYKHNSILLKKSGNFVKAGDVIAIVGNTGEQSTGPHLHFELWHNQIPVNPADFLDFN